MTVVRVTWYLYADEHQLWCGDGATRPVALQAATPEALRAFLRKELARHPVRLRLLGTLTSAPLIVDLLRQPLSEDPERLLIELGTPLLYARLPQPVNHQMAISQMGQLDVLAPSQGGWHRAQQIDLISYQLTELLNPGGGPPPTEDVSERAIRLLMQHPVWPAIAFLGTVDFLAAAKLVGLIRDPRWFVSPESPDRSSKLRRFMGLEGCHVRDLLNKLPPVNCQAQRCQLLLSVWTVGMTETPPAYPALDLPAHFLWRRAREETSPVRGHLKASELLLNLLRAVWLDALHPQRELFVPEYFFARQGREVAVVDQDGTVARAYREHCAKLTRHHNP